MNKKNAYIGFRSGGFILTQIDVEEHVPSTIAQRMCGGGFIVCEDDRWSVTKPRTVVVNLADVSLIVLTEKQ